MSKRNLRLDHNNMAQERERQKDERATQTGRGERESKNEYEKSLS